MNSSHRSRANQVLTIGDIVRGSSLRSRGRGTQVSEYGVGLRGRGVLRRLGGDGDCWGAAFQLQDMDAGWSRFGVGGTYSPGRETVLKVRGAGQGHKRGEEEGYIFSEKRKRYLCT